MPFSGCHWMKVKVKGSVVSNSLWPQGLYVHGILQARILEWVAFLFSRGSSQPRAWTQVSCTACGILCQLSHKGSPKILEWVVYPFSRWSSQPRNQTQVLLHCRWILYQLSCLGIFEWPISYLHIIEKDSEIYSGTVDMPGFSFNFTNIQNNLEENEYSDAFVAEAMTLGFPALCSSNSREWYPMAACLGRFHNRERAKVQEERMWTNTSSPMPRIRRVIVKLLDIVPRTP